MENINVYGHIFAKIKYLKTGIVEKFDFPNTVLDAGKKQIIDTLVNGKSFCITNMLFGDGGRIENTKQTIMPDRTELFGIVRVNKKVVKQIDPEIPKQAIFSIVIDYDEANGHQLNELGLQMDNGKLFSMSILPKDLTKTEEMEIAWGWLIAMV